MYNVGSGAWGLMNRPLVQEVIHRLPSVLQSKNFEMYGNDNYAQCCKASNNHAGFTFGFHRKFKDSRGAYVFYVEYWHPNPFEHSPFSGQHHLRTISNLKIGDVRIHEHAGQSTGLIRVLDKTNDVDKLVEEVSQFIREYS
jgi:hypothetical protein